MAKSHDEKYPKWAENVIDSEEPISLFVTESDIKSAVALNGQFCAFGNAAVRATGGLRGYFYKTKALIEFPDGTVRRFQVPPKAQREVIVPLDEGQREKIKPGVYTLLPPKGRDRLGHVHAPTGKGRKKKTQRPHTGHHYSPGRVITAKGLQ